MLKDFIWSLKEYFPISERFKFFCNLLRLSFSFQEERYYNDSKHNRERAKKVFYSSLEGLQIYFNFIYNLRPNNKQSLPNLLFQGEDFIDTTFAWDKTQ